MKITNILWLIPLIIILGCTGTQSHNPPHTVILVSIDGLRPDYISPENTPHIADLATQGVHAKYMEPVFPSKTFPNHYSIITGLYPANHGIINNSMYDSTLGYFRLSDREVISKSGWWGGEPLWITVQKHGYTSATYFWPGSDTDSIQGLQPTFRMEYDDDLEHSIRIDSVMAAVMRHPRPALITTYFSVVDTEGHRSGPKSEKTQDAMKDVDEHIGMLITRLKEEGVYDDINLVILGDHGMAETSKERVEIVDEYINLDDVYMIGGLDALAFFNLKDSTQSDSLLGALERMEHVRWYTSDNLPERYRYTNNERIPDIIGVADEGWQMASRERYDYNPDYYSGGTHGYDPILPSMHTAFMAHGPRFKQNSRPEGFSLIHVYELLCAVLAIPPAANDGNLDEVKDMLRDHP